MRYAELQKEIEDQLLRDYPLPIYPPEENRSIVVTASQWDGLMKMGISKYAGVTFLCPTRMVCVPEDNSFYGIGIGDLLWQDMWEERQWRRRCAETIVVLVLLGIALMIVIGGL